MQKDVASEKVVTTQNGVTITHKDGVDTITTPKGTTVTVHQDHSETITSLTAQIIPNPYGRGSGNGSTHRGHSQHHPQTYNVEAAC